MATASTFTWPEGKRAAVSLTYDDAHLKHHQVVAPFLHGQGVGATFYVPVGGTNFTDHSEAWREVARQGHELGNHTAFHPCFIPAGETRDWLDAGYNLRLYSAKRWQDEVRLANWALRQLDGKTERTYGNTCHNRFIGEGETEVCLDTLIPNFFVAGRGDRTEKAIDPATADLAAVGTASGDRRTFGELRNQLVPVRDAGQWMVYTFHGVGGQGPGAYIDEREHAQLVQWLIAENFWVAPVVDVARHVRARFPR